MVYPIFLYGSPVLRKETKEINKDYPGLQELIQNMFETLDKSEGVGLAAPQIGESIRLFIINGEPLSDDDESLKDFMQVFINAKITERTGEEKI